MCVWAGILFSLRSTRVIQAAPEITPYPAHLLQELTLARLHSVHDDLGIFRQIEKAVVLLGIYDYMVAVGKHDVLESAPAHTIEFGPVLTKQLHLQG